MELIDLRSIMPWDREMIEESVRKTGRVVVVQEDTENCSVGQMIITHLSSQQLWDEMVSPPILVSKGNVMIGYNPIYEYAALPDTERIVAAIQKSLRQTISSQPRVGDRPRVENQGGPQLLERARSASNLRRRRKSGQRNAYCSYAIHHGSDHG